MARKGSTKGNLSEVIGLVVPTAWDDADRPAGIAIMTYEELEYQVELDPIGKGLLELVHKEVQVLGRIRTVGSGGKVIEVVRYRPTGRPQTHGLKET